MRNQHKYTSEDIEFIRKNIDTMSFPKMADVFSEKYGNRFLGCSIQKVAYRNGIKKAVRVYQNGKDRKIRFDNVTEEKKDFIKDNFSSCNTYEELSVMYKKEFGVDCSRDSMNRLCIELGLSHDNAGCFRKGGRTRKLEVGTERVGSGYKQCVKVFDNELPSGNSSNWVQKSRYVYESHKGKIPKGYLIIHLDGDKNNFDIENLYCVSRRITALLASNDWFRLDKEAKLTAIKLCELNLKLKESEVV